VKKTAAIRNGEKAGERVCKPGELTLRGGSGEVDPREKRVAEAFLKRKARAKQEDRNYQGKGASWKTQFQTKKSPSPKDGIW